MASLYPTFEIPKVAESSSDKEEIFLPSPLFDFDTGDFVRDGQNRVVYVDGRDSYVLWCLKMLKTQFGACTSYIFSGVDSEGAMAESSREAVQSAFERSITDSLMMNARTERIYDFIWEWEGDALRITFTIKPKMWPAFDVNMQVMQ